MRRHDGGGERGSLRRFGTRNLLVAVQIALSLALLAASGLFVRASLAVDRADPGYRFDHQLLLRVDATTGGLDEAAGRRAYRQLIDRLVPCRASSRLPWRRWWRLATTPTVAG